MGAMAVTTHLNEDTLNLAREIVAHADRLPLNIVSRVQACLEIKSCTKTGRTTSEFPNV